VIFICCLLLTVSCLYVKPTYGKRLYVRTPTDACSTVGEHAVLLERLAQAGQGPPTVLQSGW